MSWHIKVIGERAAVKAAVENKTDLPAAVKQTILETIHDRVPDHSKSFNGVRLEGYGHENKNDDSSLGDIGKLEIEPVQLTV